MTAPHDPVVDVSVGKDAVTDSEGEGSGQGTPKTVCKTRQGTSRNIRLHVFKPYVGRSSSVVIGIPVQARFFAPVRTKGIGLFSGVNH